MDYGKILKKAWHNVRHYRALWVFGVILALTTLSLEGLVLYNMDRDDSVERQGVTIVRQEGESLFEAAKRTVREELDELDREIDRANREVERFFAKELDVEIESDIVAVLTVLVGGMLIGYVLAKSASYVAEVALIRLVDESEETGVQHSARQGWRMGLSWAAWRIFLINLVVDVSAFCAFLLLFALVLAPLGLWATDSTPAGVVGTLITVTLLLPSIGLTIVAAAALAMSKPFFRRACVLEGRGVTGSIRYGFAVVRRRLGKVVPVGLVNWGVSMAWPLLVAPVAALLGGIGLLLGGTVALLVGLLTRSFLEGATPWLLAGALGIPIFVLTMAVPLAFLGGLREVFLSSTWTLTYRELLAMEAVESGRVSDLDAPGLEAAAAA